MSGAITAETLRLSAAIAAAIACSLATVSLAVGLF